MKLPNFVDLLVSQSVAAEVHLCPTMMMVVFDYSVIALTLKFNDVLQSQGSSSVIHLVMR